MIDLHTHSNASDGSDSPQELVEKAKLAGCSTIALTDHDTLDGLNVAQQRGREVGVEVLAGVELSCHTATRNVHILGIGIDPFNTQLLSRLTGQRRLRDERNLALVERLGELGTPVSMDQVLKHGKGPSVGRPHFAAAMVELGYVDSIGEAFRRYLGDGQGADVHRQELSVDEGIGFIRRAGGVAVWAHPFPRNDTRSKDLSEDLAQMKAAGLGGMECWYGRYSPFQRKQLADLAASNGLVATGGSDYHGTYKSDLSLGTGTGDLEVPPSALNDLRSALREQGLRRTTPIARQQTRAIHMPFL